MGCVCERRMLRAVVSRLGNGDCVCVGPVWGPMVGVDDDGRQRCKLCAGLVVRFCAVVAMLRLCVGVCVGVMV